MGTPRSGSIRNSAGCRFSAGIFLYSAHIDTIEGPHRHYRERGHYCIPGMIPGFDTPGFDTGYILVHQCEARNQLPLGKYRFCVFFVLVLVICSDFFSCFPFVRFMVYFVLF